MPDLPYPKVNLGFTFLLLLGGLAYGLVVGLIFWIVVQLLLL